MPDGKFQEGTRQAEKTCLTFLKSGERGRLEQILSGGGPRGLREESAGLGLGLEGELLCLSEVARGSPRGRSWRGRQGGSAALGAGQGMYSEVLLLLPGLVVGNGTGWCLRL